MDIKQKSKSVSRRKVLTIFAGTASIPLITTRSDARKPERFNPKDLNSIINFLPNLEGYSNKEYIEFIESLSGRSKEAIIDLSKSWFVRHKQKLIINDNQPSSPTQELSRSELVITDDSIPKKWGWDVSHLVNSPNALIRTGNINLSMIGSKQRSITQSSLNSGTAHYSDSIEESLGGVIGYEWEHEIDWDYSYYCDLDGCWNLDVSNGINNHNPWTGIDVSYDGIVSENSYYQEYNPDVPAYHSDRQVKFDYWTPDYQFEWYPYIDLAGSAYSNGFTKDKDSGVD